mgnify:CR=1 FL=1
MFNFPAAGRIFPNRNAIATASASSRRSQKKAVRRSPQAKKKMDHQKLTKSCAQYVNSASRDSFVPSPAIIAALIAIKI